MNRVLVQCVLASAAIASVGILAPATRADTVVRFDMNYSVNSSSGPLNYFEVQLYDTAAPITVANFLKYVNDGLYNNTIVHRDAKDFVMQGGGFTPATVNGTVTALNPITTFPPIQNEFSATRSNLVGTLAMAKLGNDPNSATSQWFVNLGDNSANLDSQNGGFTVFGKVLGDGMTLINAVNSLPTYDLRASFGGAFEAVPKFNNGASFVTVTKAAVVPPTGSLSGFVYLDANHNGVRDALDYALADAQVSVMQAGSNTVLATVQSGKDGSYSLGGLPAGTYSVKMQTPTSVAGQDNGSQQKILDKNGSVVSTGLVGTVQPNACNNVVLGEYQTGQNFSFAEAAYPAALMSSRMLLNDYAGVPSVGTIAGTSTNAASTSLLATTVPDSIAVPGGGNASANSSGVTPVPEPGSLVLLVVGGLALGGLAWRRRNGR